MLFITISGEEGPLSKAGEEKVIPCFCNKRSSDYVEDDHDKILTCKGVYGNCAEDSNSAHRVALHRSQSFDTQGCRGVKAKSRQAKKRIAWSSKTFLKN